MVRANNEIPYSRFYLFLLIITALIGGLIYLGVASLYQFVFLAIVLLVFLGAGMELRISENNPIAKFLWWMFLEAGISIIWAPDKGLAGKYTYYVLLLFLYAYLFDNLVTRNSIEYVTTLMVMLLLALNLIGIWESVTGHHLLPDYLGNAGRARMLAYVPGGFFMNPNDFATYLIQILPFSFIASISEKNKIGIIAIINIFLSAYVILRTESRTQIIMMIVLLIYFIAIAVERRKAMKLILLIVVGSVLALTFYPSFGDYLTQGLASISGDEIVKSSEGGSLGTRIALLKNCGMILLNTVGFGVGAGCHRVVMKSYSAKYFYTGKVTAMHNILGEIFADYGVFIGVFFIITLVNTVRRLKWISQNDPSNAIAAKLYIATLATFVICGISSSSIIQLTSIWTTFCYIGAFVRISSETVSGRGNA